MFYLQLINSSSMYEDNLIKNTGGCIQHLVCGRYYILLSV